MSKKVLDKARVCDGKTKHKTAGAAWQEKRHTHCDQSMLDVYRCPFCHFWHIGHTNRGVGR